MATMIKENMERSDKETDPRIKTQEQKNYEQLVYSVIGAYELNKEDLDISDEVIDGYEVLTFDDDEQCIKVAPYDYAVQLATESIKESVWAFSAGVLYGYVNEGVSMDLIEIVQKECENANQPLIDLINAGQGMERFIDGAISSDGIGHFLNSYDGDYDEYVIDGEVYVSWIE